MRTGREGSVDFTFSEEQQMLRDTVRAFVADKSPLGAVREWAESGAGHDPALWAEMAGLGLPAMHIPEEYGGAGFSYRELGIVLEELGRELTASPLFATVVLGANLVMVAGTEGQRTDILPGVATGGTTMTVAVVDEGGGWEPDRITTTLTETGDGLVLDGVKSYVVDGHLADLIVVVATDGLGRLRFVVIPSDTPGVTTSAVTVMDTTRPMARVVLDGVTVPGSAELTGGGEDAFERFCDLAAVGLGYEQLGGAERVMETAVAYAKERYQFGRPIGSFQAIKHACADMLVGVEATRSAVYAAGWAVDNDPVELAVLAPLAHGIASDTYFEVAAENIQVHGGIGFTWEHDAHLYFKRAKTSQMLLGAPSRWRSRLGDRIGV